MTGERARVSVNPGEQGRARMHETPCLRKRQTRIISIEESSEDQKNKTHSLDHRDLPQKKTGSDAAKKKWCRIGIINLHTPGSTMQLMLLCRKLRCFSGAPQLSMVLPSSSKGPGENLFAM